MTPVSRQLVLKVPGQPHEARDWHGQFTHLYSLTMLVPLRVSETLTTPTTTTTSVRMIPSEALDGYLHIDCEVMPQPTKTRQRNDHVLAQPSIALLIRQLRRKFNPGDEEVFTLPITHVMFTDDAGSGWVKTGNDRVSPLNAATNRLRYMYVNFNADARAQLSVWLDQLYTEGVLT